MVWCSLRFSDIHSVSTFRANLGRRDPWLVWRSKTSPTGFAWGCWDCGATGLSWGREFGAFLAVLREAFPKRDFLLSDGARPLQCNILVRWPSFADVAILH